MQPRNATVSLCMIVRNEERNLDECLQPVAYLFDEIVIVDTGSQDATKEIAERYTDQVFDFAWCDDFSAARNESLRRAYGDWILWLDADDRIRPENVDRLGALFEKLDHRPGVYYMDTVLHGHYECEGPQLVSHPRLVRRHPNLQWRGRIHEQFLPAALELGYETFWTGIQIDHLGYRDPVLQRRKLQRDVRLLRMDYAVDPDDASTLLHLGMAYAELGNHSAAKSFLRRLVADDRFEGDGLSRVYRVLADLSMRDGNPAESLRILARGLARYPGDNGLLYSQALVQFELSQFDAARASLERIISGPEERLHHVVPGEIKRKLAPRKLADVFRMQQKYDVAEHILRSLLGDFPTDTHAWYALGCVYGDTGQNEPLHAVIERLHACPEGNLFAGVLLALWHMRHGELEPARILIDGLISDIPEVPLPRLLRCQWLELKGAPLEHRLQGCRDLLRVQPGNPQALSALQVLENANCVVTAPTTANWYSSVVIGAGVPT